MKKRKSLLDNRWVLATVSAACFAASPGAGATGLKAPGQPGSGVGAALPVLGVLEIRETPVRGALTISDIEDPYIQDMKLGPGDEIVVTVFRHDELGRTLRVPNSGVIFFPLVGEIRVINVGLRDFRNDLVHALSRYVLDPQISVEVKASQGQKILVLGEVRQPGMFHIQEPTSAIEAVSLAGGFTPDADLKDVFLVRAARAATDPEVSRLDMKAVLHTGAFEQNPMLKGGELIYVSPRPLENVARFFDRMWRVVRPIVFAEQGIVLYPDAVDAFHGRSPRDQRVIIIPAP